MFARYAVFYTPIGALADFGAAWLGWDSAQGRAMPHLAVVGIDVAMITATPEIYGLHGTLKAPFTLARSGDPVHLQQAVSDFAHEHATFDIGEMELRRDCDSVALRPAIGSAASTVQFFHL